MHLAPAMLTVYGTRKTLTNGSPSSRYPCVTPACDCESGSAMSAAEGKDGPFVVIELKAETRLDATPRKSHIETAEERAERDRLQGGPGLKAGWSTGGNDIYPGSATVTQTADIKTTKGRKNSSVPSPDRSCRITCASRKGRL